METLFQALGMAAPTWQQAMERLTWSHGLILVIYLAAAWLCVLNGHIAQTARQPHKAWYLAATALCLLGANALLQGDVLVTQVMRSIAKMEGWYGVRRDAQYLLVGLLALMVWPAWLRLNSAFTASGSAAKPLVWGLTLLLLVFLLRMVSAHGTDAVLNLRLIGLSVGRWVELAGLALVIQGSLRCLRLR